MGMMGERKTPVLLRRGPVSGNVMDGQLLTADEKAQVRAFRDRLAAACERHNERGHGVQQPNP